MQLIIQLFKRFFIVIEAQYSSPSSQISPLDLDLSQLNPANISTTNFSAIKFSHVSSFLEWSQLTRFSSQNFIRISCFPIYITCTTHFTLPYLSILTKLGEENELRNSPLCNFLIFRSLQPTEVSTLSSESFF